MSFIETVLPNSRGLVLLDVTSLPETALIAAGKETHLMKGVVAARSNTPIEISLLLEFAHFLCRLSFLLYFKLNSFYS